MKSFKDILEEGLFDTKIVSTLKSLYTEFNQVEQAVLDIYNFSLPDGKLKRAVIDYYSKFIDSGAQKKSAVVKIAKIHELANEIYNLTNDLKSELNDYNNEKYPKEMGKLK
jgi:hypothetical protein